MKTEEILVFDDMFDIWNSPEWPAWTWGAIAAGIIAFIALILIVRTYLLQRSKPVDYHKQALFQLTNMATLLEDEDYITIKMAYIQLFVIIKEYLDGTYGLTTLSKTDYEVITYLQNYENKIVDVEDWLTVLQNIQNHAIQAKFEHITIAKDVLYNDYQLVCNAFKRVNAS